MKVGYSILILFVTASVANVISYDCFNPNNKLGLCVSLYYCPTLLRLFLNSPTGLDNATFLQESYCKNGFGASPFVCCTNAISYYNDTEEHNTIPRKNLLATQEECTRDDFLSFADIGGYFGSLINDRYILTSAAAANSMGNIVSYIGKNNTGFTIEKKIIHNKTESKMFSHIHNIALLRLSESVQFSSEIAPICLPSAVSYRKYEDGEQVSYPQKFGDYIFVNYYEGFVNNCCPHSELPDQFCIVDIRHRYKDYRIGPGAPVVDTRNGTYVVDGIQSTLYARSCNGITYVSPYEDWILSHIEP